MNQNILHFFGQICNEQIFLWPQNFSNWFKCAVRCTRWKIADTEHSKSLVIQLHWREKSLRYLSTATTTLWELVSPTDSWKLAICLLSTPPLTKLPETQCTKSAVIPKQSSIQNTVSTCRQKTQMRMVCRQKNPQLMVE